MLFDRRILYATALLFGALFAPCSGFAQIDEGDQVIDGTQVHTRIDHGRGVATFSNSCGSQTLTQRQLQNGAKPTNIIPCPRGGGGGGSGCKSGEVSTRSGGCMPKGATDCGNGTYCRKGSSCTRDRKCKPHDEDARMKCLNERLVVIMQGYRGDATEAAQAAIDVIRNRLIPLCKAFPEEMANAHKMIKEYQDTIKKFANDLKKEEANKKRTKEEEEKAAAIARKKDEEMQCRRTPSWCPSSSSLMQCVEGPVQTGDTNPTTGAKNYSFGLNAACTAESYLVLVERFKDDGSCKQDILQIFPSKRTIGNVPGDGGWDNVESTSIPKVLGVFALVPGNGRTARELDACYRAEHQNVPCSCLKRTPTAEAIEGTPVNHSVSPILTIQKPASGTCPAGYVPARNMQDKCVKKNTSECHYAPVTCPLTSGGCCFNAHTPPVENVKGYFCCPTGTQCVFAEGQDRGVCLR